MNQELKKVRLSRGYSIAKLAKKVGISKTYCFYIEKGKRNVSYHLAVKFANVLKTTPDALFLQLESTKCEQTKWA